MIGRYVKWVCERSGEREIWSLRGEGDYTSATCFGWSAWKWEGGYGGANLKKKRFQGSPCSIAEPRVHTQFSLPVSKEKMNGGAEKGGQTKTKRGAPQVKASGQNHGSSVPSNKFGES